MLGTHDPYTAKAENMYGSTLSHSLACLIALSFFCSSVFCTRLATAAKPNVIVIYTDDQGYGDVSCLNPESKFQTPNMDRLAKEGIAFTDAHCSDTVCTPSRYGLLTGRYSWRTTLKTGVMVAEGKCLIDSDRMTIASFLSDHGYDTAMVGKWHLGMDFPGTSHSDRDWSLPVQDMPLDKGFDYFYGVPASLNYGVLAWFEGRHAKVPPSLFTAKKPNKRHVDYRIKPPYQSTPEQTKAVLNKSGFEVAPDFVDNQCLTRFTDRAIDWIQKQQSQTQPRPFFLYLPYTSPHYPVCPLPEFHGQGKAGGYGEFMIETDYHVGRLLKFLDEANLTEDTLVVLTSDNGPEKSWTQREKQFQHRSNGVFREGKRSVYEGGHRVPFFVRWPSGIKTPDRLVTDLVCQTDLLATLADILDVKLPDDAGEDSQSFYATLKNAEAEHRRVPLVHHAMSGRFAIRDANWKLVMPHGNSKAELYDLQGDPSERRNVIDQHGDLAAQMQSKLTRIVRQGRSTTGKTQRNDTGYWRDLTWMDEMEY